MVGTYEVDAHGDLILMLTSETLAIFNTSAGNEDTSETPSPAKKQRRNTRPAKSGSRAGPPSSELRVKVSSKHLCLASRYFDTMLSGSWAEATTVYDDGCRHANLEVVDLEAFKILMDVIHGRSRKVPRTVSLYTLAKLAVLVDYFDCHDVVGIVSDLWVEGLKSTVPESICKELILWMFISSVFRVPEIFESTTEAAILRSTGPIGTMGLPIMDSIVEDVESGRQKAIECMVDALYKLMDDFRDGKMGCSSSECQSLLLGALIKEMHAFSLFSPQRLGSSPRSPDAPTSYVGFSLEKLWAHIGGFKSKPLPSVRTGYGYSEPSHAVCRLPRACELGAFIKPIHQKHNGFARGLDLSKYLPKQPRRR